MEEKAFFVYMLANKPDGVLYLGVTSNLPKRVWEHKEGQIDGFTKKYNVKTLVWFEKHETAEAAITREKQMKEWKRSWKIKRIEAMNKEWRDLYETICA